MTKILKNILSSDGYDVFLMGIIVLYFGAKLYINEHIWGVDIGDMVDLKSNTPLTAAFRIANLPANYLLEFLYKTLGLSNEFIKAMIALFGIATITTSIYKISLSTFANKRSAILAVILFLFSSLYFSVSAAKPVWENNLTTLCFSFLMLGILYWLKDRYVLASLFIGLSFDCHPIYPIALILVFFAYSLIRYKRVTLKTVVLSLFVFLITTFPVTFSVAKSALFTVKGSASGTPTPELIWRYIRVAEPEMAFVDIRPEFHMGFSIYFASFLLLSLFYVYGGKTQREIFIKLFLLMLTTISFGIFDNLNSYHFKIITVMNLWLNRFTSYGSVMAYVILAGTVTYTIRPTKVNQILQVWIFSLLCFSVLSLPRSLWLIHFLILETAVIYFIYNFLRIRKGLSYKALTLNIVLLSATLIYFYYLAICHKYPLGVPLADLFNLDKAGLSFKVFFYIQFTEVHTFLKELITRHFLIILAVSEFSFLFFLLRNIDTLAEKGGPLLDGLATAVKKRRPLLSELATAVKERRPLLNELATAVKEMGALLNELAIAVKKRRPLLSELAIAVKKRRRPLLNELATAVKEIGALLNELAIAVKKRRPLLSELATAVKERRPLLNELATAVKEIGALLNELAIAVKKRGALLTKSAVVGGVIIVISIGIWATYKNSAHTSIMPFPSTAYMEYYTKDVFIQTIRDMDADTEVAWDTDADTEVAWDTDADTEVAWDMDADTGDEMVDSTGRYNATLFNTEITEGYSGKARYFDGQNAYIQTPIDFKGWKGVTISFWVRPEHKGWKELSVILDNGHDAKTNFAIQSADFSGEKWVWHCNGISVLFNLPLDKWTHVVVVADGAKGLIKAYTNGLKAAEVNTGKGFEFGDTPLCIGKLAKLDERYFKGSIDEVIILDKAIDKPRHSATPFNIEVTKGCSRKARYFDGQNAYIQTPIDFKGWKGVTISFWVRPERKGWKELSVILDNGHDAKTNFAIQSADFSGEKWVWHCNGISVLFNLPLDKWTHVVVVADGAKGLIKAYTNGLKAAEVNTGKGFEFGDTPLCIGKLAKLDERYFKGSIAEVIIANRAIDRLRERE